MARKKDRYFTTEFQVRVRRTHYSLSSVTVETVGPYLAELLAFQRRLKEIDYDAERYFGCSKEGISDRESALEDEINHCKFFLGMAKRRAEDPDFDKWVFVPKDKAKWNRRYDAWVRDNGKIEAKVEIIPTPVRTKLHVRLEDSNLAKKCGFVFAPTAEGYETAAYQKEERVLEEIASAKVRLDHQMMRSYAKLRWSLNDLLEGS